MATKLGRTTSANYVSCQSGVWGAARKKLLPQVKELQKLLKIYDYSDKSSSVVTDEKVCSLLLKELRKSKEQLFHMIQLLYELHREGATEKSLVRLRDELDIFLDEIKVRYCEWKGLGQKWLELLIKHDLELINEAGALNRALERLYREILHLKEIRVDHRVVEKEGMDKIEKGIKAIGNRMDRMVMLFKEREAICNIRPVSLERMYRKIRQEIRKSV